MNQLHLFLPCAAGVEGFLADEVHAITGASNKDLAEATRLAPPAITRACATLVAQGWCRKSEETGRFYPTHQFTRLAFRVLDDIQRAEQRLQDQRQALTGHASI